MDVDCGSARDRLGQTLAGTYVLKEVLGAGGTAVVYRAETVDGRSCAVKILHDHLSRSDEVCRRFVREGQVGNVLDHPGTVRVHDHGATEDGSPYLVLDLLEGESLEQRRERLGGRLELGETLAFCDQLLAVLEVAHARNIIHRDIKPSNLFVTRQGQIKVLDFGIARLIDDSSSPTATKTGQMVGTPAFMPPEQALSRPRDVDARTDLWAVGATLFTLLSGEHVHVAESSSEHLVKAATLHARSLAKALTGVPTNVEALVARSLSFDKNARWSSAAEMRAALAAVRRDPGRRIGISVEPPPEGATSDANVPLDSMSNVVPPSWRTPMGVTLSRPISREETVTDLDVLTSMTTSPGHVRAGRRRWLLPLAVASTSLLVVMSAVVLMLVVRAPAPGNVAAASTAPPRAASALPPAATVAPAPAETAPVAVASSVAAAVETAAPRSTTAAPARTAAAPKRVTTTPRRDASSRKDVYRPF